MCRDVWVSRDSVHLSVWWLGSLTWRTIADADVYEVRPSIYNSLCYMNIRNIFYEKCELLPTLYWAWYSWILLSGTFQGEHWCYFKGRTCGLPVTSQERDVLSTLLSFSSISLSSNGRGKKPSLSPPHRGLRMETSSRWHFAGTVESSEDNHGNSITVRVILNGTLSKPMSKVRITIPLEGSGLRRVPVKPQQCVAFNRKCAGRRQEKLNWDQSPTVRILFRVISGFSPKTY